MLLVRTAMIDYPVLMVGILGMLLIIAGWITGLSNTPPLRLSTLYLAGSILLTIYAMALGDPIFTILNALAAFVAALNVVRGLQSKEPQETN